jgi:iron-sulfur cluster insertion protein
MSEAKNNTGVEMFSPDDDLLEFTDNAAKKVASLIAEEENEALMLRVFVSGGGCSGFQYGFTFDEAQETEDTVIEKSVVLSDVAVEDHDDDDDDDGGEGGEGGDAITVKLLIDPMSFQYLVGATIDYKEDLSGAQFVIRNPNAKTTCGCGSSFSV